jgi:hypothetical protein
LGNGRGLPEPGTAKAKDCQGQGPRGRRPGLGSLAKAAHIATVGFMSIFEIIMLVCFGAAWPFSIYRSYRSRATGGKSVFFLIVILVGYVAGIANKLFYRFDNVVYLYVLNFAMVSVDTALWFRNRKLEKKA